MEKYVSFRNHITDFSSMAGVTQEVLASILPKYQQIKFTLELDSSSHFSWAQFYNQHDTWAGVAELVLEDGNAT